jgi:hypothetical protein
VLTPAQIIVRLEAIEQDLADRQPEFEDAAGAWTRAKRDKELAWADAYMAATGEVTTRKAAAIRASEHIGKEAEGRYVALSKVCGVLETRAMIAMSLLKSHGRIEGPVSPSGRVYGRQA